MRDALLLIDFQTGFDAPVWGTRNNPDAELNAKRLLTAFRAEDAAVLHVRHLSQEAGSPLSGDGASFIDTVHPLPHEPTFEKSVNSAFIGTDLEVHLRQNGITQLTICGLTTPHCISTTTRMAANLGFSVTLAHDACAAFTANADSRWGPLPPMSAEQIHNSAVSHLHGEFAIARSTNDILARTGVGYE